MQIAVLTNKGFVFKEAKRPECGPEQVLVKTASCGICTGEVEHYHKVTSGTKSVESVLGHEGSGYVAAVGAHVKGFREGDPVTALDGCFAGYFLTKPEKLVRLPQGVDPKWAIGEAVACSMHAAQRFGIELGDRVAVLGAGFMGLMCLQLSLLRGAGHVCAIDPVPWRLKAAEKLGADSTYHLPADSLKGVADELGEFDVVLEVAGTASAITLAGEIVRQHGRIVLVGYHLSNDGMRRVNMERWNYKAIDVINGHVRRDDEKLQAMKAGMDLLASGRLKTKPLITPYALSDIRQAFRDLAGRKQGLLKATLVP